MKTYRNTVTALEEIATKCGRKTVLKNQSRTRFGGFLFD